VPDPVRLAAAVAIVFVAVAVLAPGTAAATWLWPARGEVVGAFAFSPSAPYAAGQRRGVDIAARPGALVRAACAGRVTFAGRLPGGGRGVTIACGRLAATHLRLGRAYVRRGARVAAGAALGVAGQAGVVRLGARLTRRRFGYVDPLTLLGPERLPFGPAPAARPAQRPRRTPVPPRLRPVRPPGVRAVPVARRVPAAGWAGLALLAAGLPLGGLARARRRRRSRHQGLARVPR
jgi:murein DD-endopeptidase MepM/ murein hydrolase activator NlpD